MPGRNTPRGERGTPRSLSASRRAFLAFRGGIFRRGCGRSLHLLLRFLRETERERGERERARGEGGGRGRNHGGVATPRARPARRFRGDSAREHKGFQVPVFELAPPGFKYSGRTIRHGTDDPRARTSIHPLAGVGAGAGGAGGGCGVYKADSAHRAYRAGY